MIPDKNPFKSCTILVVRFNIPMIEKKAFAKGLKSLKNHEILILMGDIEKKLN